VRACRVVRGSEGCSGWTVLHRAQLELLAKHAKAAVFSGLRPCLAATAFSQRVVTRQHMCIPGAVSGRCVRHDIRSEVHVHVHGHGCLLWLCMGAGLTDSCAAVCGFLLFSFPKFFGRLMGGLVVERVDEGS
jgi:hypothetical protein